MLQNLLIGINLGPFVGIGIGLAKLVLSVSATYLQKTQFRKHSAQKREEATRIILKYGLNLFNRASGVSCFTYY